MVAIGVAVGAALLTGVVWITQKPNLPLLVDPPLIAIAIDAGIAQPEVPDAAVAVVVAPAAIDAGLAAVAVVDAGEVKPIAVAGPRMLRIEFRIRPFAQVFLDGRELGETPFPAVSVSVGRHKIRLVNAQLKKDVEVDAQFHPGDTSFKYNLKE
jgi:hypothetical protein